MWNGILFACLMSSTTNGIVLNLEINAQILIVVRLFSGGLMKFKVLYADCPWQYRDNKGNLPALGGKTYPTMSLEEIKTLPIPNISDKDCILFLWVTMPLLQEGLDVMQAWGFTYTTCAFVWVKLNPLGEGIYSGLGHWVNGNAELCLLGKKGRPQRIAKNIKQIVFAPRGRHSVKPDEVRDRIVQLMGDLPRIELFAREVTEGWVAIGNNITGNDIRQDLEFIASL